MDELKIIKGNTFSTVTEVKAYTYDNELIGDFDLSSCTDIQIKAHIGSKAIPVYTFQVEDGNKIVIRWEN